MGATKGASRRIDYYHQGYKSTKALPHRLRALRGLRGFRMLTDDSRDSHNLVATSIASRK